MIIRVIVTGLLVLVIAAAATGLVVWMIHTKPRPELHKPQRSAQAVVAPPVEALRDHQVQIVGYGSARPRVQLPIVPEVSGRIVAKAANCLSGDYIRRGQMICKIDETDYVQARDSAQRQIELIDVRLKRLDTEQANLSASEALERGRLKLAVEQLTKARQLLTRGAATQNDVDTAEEGMLARKAQLQSILNQAALIEPQRRELLAQANVAKVQLEQARTALKRTTITSPVTGRVIRCPIEVGERVAVGQVCGEIYGTEIMEVPVSVPATDLTWLPLSARQATTAPAAPDGQVRGNVPATVLWDQAEAGPPARWTGHVSRIEAGLAAQTRTATIVVEVNNAAPETGQRTLDRNMFCKVTIAGRTLPVAYILPRQAILADGGVYVVNDGRLHRRQVKVVRLTGQTAMLLPGGGVEAGDRVITGYVPKPVIGMRVRPVDHLAAPGEAAGSPASDANQPGAAPAGDRS